MYSMRTCPLVNKQNQVPMGAFWECKEPSCRFQVEGVCALLAAYIESKENRRILKCDCRKTSALDSAPHKKADGDGCLFAADLTISSQA